MLSPQPVQTRRPGRVMEFRHRPLAQRHSRLRAEIHRHKFPAQKFRERGSRDHGRITSRRRARRKKYSKPLHPRLALKSSPQFPIRRTPAAYKQSSNVILARRCQRFHDQVVHHRPLKRSHQIEGLPVAKPPNVFESRLVYSRKRLTPNLNRRFHVLRLDIAQNRRLDSAIGKIKVRSVFFGRDLLMIALFTIAAPTIADLLIAPVRMLDLRNLKLDRLWIAIQRKPVNNRSSRISESQKLSDFIESLSGSIVASMANVPVAPEILVHLGEIKMRVSSRDHQRKHRKMKLCISSLPLLKQYRVDVSLKMIHGNQRLLC